VVGVEEGAQRLLRDLGRDLHAGSVAWLLCAPGCGRARRAGTWGSGPRLRDPFCLVDVPGIRLFRLGFRLGLHAGHDLLEHLQRPA
jgi:hypothetical protein